MARELKAWNPLLDRESNQPRVGHFSTYVKGGAAVAARRIHDGLKSIGLPSRFLYSTIDENEPPDSSYSKLQIESEKTNSLLEPVYAKIRRWKRHDVREHYRENLTDRPAGFEVFSAARAFTGTPVDFAKMKLDLVHLHWTAFMFDFPTFFASIPVETPIVWTLHDMNPFTGGCHYSSGCERFQSGCGFCPQIRNPNAKDVSRRSLETKRESLQLRNITVVSPTHWLLRLAMNSPVFPKNTEFRVIPYGLDLKAFSPLNKTLAKQSLNLPTNRPIIGFGAEDLTNRRKGMHLLFESLKALPSDTKPIALVFGNGALPTEVSESIDVRRLGFLANDESKKIAYSAMDMFAMPSLEDNQPQTGLEALACGTAVVAFDAGGISEYVRDEKTGLLARVGNHAELMHKLYDLSKHIDKAHALGRKGRSMIEQEFSSERQARDYQSLYAEKCHWLRVESRLNTREAA